MAPFDGKYMTSYLMTIAMFALSHTVNDIFANQIKCQKFDVENEGWDQRRKKGTCAIRL